MANMYLAVDLGAESGRVIAGQLDGQRVAIEEIHRFANGPVSIHGSLRWNVLNLWSEILKGLSKAASQNRKVASIGVDTWGVDYVLLDKAGELLGLPYNYRDARTQGKLAWATSQVPRETIFAETGLQFMEINTLYQLLAHLEHDPELLARAHRLLLMPDFFHWCLSGSEVVEFTNATTTQLVHPARRQWSDKLIDSFHLPRGMFPEIVTPGTCLGTLRADVASGTRLGRVPIVTPATHDTASAVAAVPTDQTGTPSWAYISSGTWSLIGVEVNDAILSEQALAENVTNEGGIDGTYRLLKNVMGLWLVQGLRRSFEQAGHSFDYEELTEMAVQAPPFAALVDPNDNRFLSPTDMREAFKSYCDETNQRFPDSPGALVRCALESLALKYAMVLDRLEMLTGVPITTIHIVGGGCQNHLLNQFTANACGRTVVAGPVEATALGNVLVQARAAGAVGSLSEIRTIVRDSYELTTFEPTDQAAWRHAMANFPRIA